MSFFKRFAAFIFSIAFSFTSTVSAAPSCYEINVPDEYGKITQRYRGSSEKTIVHIQDAHLSYDAQSHISSAIAFLKKKNGLKLIGVEGGVGSVSTDRFRVIDLKDERESVAGSFMRKGLFSGAEYAAVLDKEIELFGVESLDAFQDNFRSFFSVKTNNDIVINGLGVLSNLAADDIKFSGNAELINVFNAYRSYINNVQNIGDAVRDVLVMASDAGIDIYEQVNLMCFAESLHDGSKTGHLKTELVNFAEMFSEIEAVFFELMKFYCAEFKQTRAVDVLHSVKLIEKVCSLEAVRDEVQMVKTVDVSGLCSFLKERGPSSFNIHDFQDALNSVFFSSIDFYDCALNRDHAFVDNLLRRMDEEQEDLAVLVSGGFHTKGVTNLLRERGVNYIVFTPSLLDLNNTLPYEELMTGKLFPIKNELISTLRGLTLYIHGQMGQLYSDFNSAVLCRALEWIVEGKEKRENIESVLKRLENSGPFGSYSADEEKFFDVVKRVRERFDDLISRMQSEGRFDVNAETLSEELLSLEFEDEYSELVDLVAELFDSVSKGKSDASGQESDSIVADLSVPDADDIDNSKSASGRLRNNVFLRFIVPDIAGQIMSGLVGAAGFFYDSIVKKGFGVILLAFTAGVVFFTPVNSLAISDSAYDFFKQNSQSVGYQMSGNVDYRKSIDENLDTILRTYFYYYGNDFSSIYKNGYKSDKYSRLAKIFKGGIPSVKSSKYDDFLENISFDRFSSTIKEYLKKEYGAAKKLKGSAKDRKLKAISRIEKEVVFWLGDLMKLGGKYDPFVRSGSYKNISHYGITMNGVYNFFIGNNYQGGASRYTCLTFSMSMSMLAHECGLSDDALTVVSVERGNSGERYSITRDVGHVCNLLKTVTGESFIVDYGRITPHKQIWMIDQSGNEFLVDSDILFSGDLPEGLSGIPFSDFKELNKMNELQKKRDELLSPLGYEIDMNKHFSTIRKLIPLNEELMNLKYSRLISAKSLFGLKGDQADCKKSVSMGFLEKELKFDVSSLGLDTNVLQWSFIETIDKRKDDRKFLLNLDSKIRHAKTVLADIPQKQAEKNAEVAGISVKLDYLSQLVGNYVSAAIYNELEREYVQDQRKKVPNEKRLMLLGKTTLAENNASYVYSKKYDRLMKKQMQGVTFLKKGFCRGENMSVGLEDVDDLVMVDNLDFTELDVRLAGDKSLQAFIRDALNSGHGARNFAIVFDDKGPLSIGTELAYGENYNGKDYIVMHVDMLRKFSETEDGLDLLQRVVIPHEKADIDFGFHDDDIGQAGQYRPQLENTEPGDFERLREVWASFFNIQRQVSFENEILKQGNRDLSLMYMQEVRKIMQMADSSNSGFEEFIGEKIIAAQEKETINIFVSPLVRENELFEKVYRPLLAKFNFNVSFIEKTVVDGQQIVNVVGADGKALGDYSSLNPFVLSTPSESDDLYSIFGSQIIRFDPSSIAMLAGFVAILINIRNLREKGTPLTKGLLDIKNRIISFDDIYIKEHLSDEFAEVARTRLVKASA